MIGVETYCVYIWICSAAQPALHTDPDCGIAEPDLAQIQWTAVGGVLSAWFLLTFSHLADAFVQSDVQGREQSSYKQ